MLFEKEVTQILISIKDQSFDLKHPSFILIISDYVRNAIIREGNSELSLFGNPFPAIDRQREIEGHFQKLGSTGIVRLPPTADYKACG